MTTDEVTVLWIVQWQYMHKKKKANFTLEQAIKAQRDSEGIALLFL